jgi:UDP-arabinose 4-epimerase
MIVLVTGGAGYIGSHACKALAAAGHVPVTFDNLSLGHRWAVKWGPLVVGDTGDRGALREAMRAHRAEAVMHFAASAYVGASNVDPRAYYTNNVVNGLNLLDAMLDEGVTRLVFSSSCATYGHQHTPLLAEDHPQLPVNPYGETKLALERAIRWYGAAYGLRAVTLRYFNAAGADADGEIGETHDPEPHIIPIVLRAAAGELPQVDVFGDDYPTPDGTAVRDYVHVTDLADAHVRALAHLEGGGESVELNLGSERGFSVRELVAAASRIAGREMPVRISPRRRGDPPRLVADGAAARRLLGWTPHASTLDAMLGSAWRWHQRGRQP